MQKLKVLHARNKKLKDAMKLIYGLENTIINHLILVRAGLGE